MPKQSFKLVTRLKNDVPVYVDLSDSHAATHIQSHPELLGYAKDFLKRQEFEKAEVVVEYDTKRIIGLKDVVETSDSDEIVYAKRLNRDNYTRFVKNRSSVPTTTLTMVLRRHTEEDFYELWSIWLGESVPPFPGDDTESPDSLEFWSKHALAWGTQPVQKGTATTVRPW